MQTVNFNCPHCGNLMAVGMNLLGRNVRCPHCKAVVQAPTAPGQPMSTPASVPQPIKPPEPPPAPMSPIQTTSSAPTLPQFNLPPKETEPVESIFGQAHDEDVFGSVKPKPIVPQDTTQNVLPPNAFHRPDMTPNQLSNFSQSDANPVSSQEPEIEPLDNFDSRVDDQAPTIETPTKQKNSTRSSSSDEGKGTSAFAVILLIYGLLMTIAAGVFGYLSFTKTSEPQHPFYAIPDVFGEYEKANRKQTSLKWLPDSRAEVPAGLKVKLGEELVVGDLSVTPLEVKSELITAVEKFNVGEDRVRPVGPKTLVMSLKVRNLSKEVSFYPTDPAFLRRVEPKIEESRNPYTYLEFNRDRFYGVFPWPPTGNTLKEYVQGHESNEKILKPGEENTIFVTVAPKQDVVRSLDRLAADQPLLWKVQLRRGLITYKDESGREGEFSATAVIGVSFKKDQIH